METLLAEASPPLFGPPILPVATAPSDRPLAVALVLDISLSMYGNERVLDMFKARLIEAFSHMEYDNVLLLGNELHEDPGAAVAGIHRFVPGVRNLPASIKEAVAGLDSIDRFYRRCLFLVTDQFSVRDVTAMVAAVNRNALRLTDISFHAVGFGPLYSRGISECGWDFKHLDEPSELDAVLNEVCK